MFRDGLLAGKRTLITGGGTGLGKSIGRRLVSDNAGFITGEVIVIDGGKWLQGAAGPSAFNMQGWSSETWENLRKRNP